VDENARRVRTAVDYLETQAWNKRNGSSQTGIYSKLNRNWFVFGIRSLWPR